MIKSHGYDNGQSNSYQTLEFWLNWPSLMTRPFQPAVTSTMYMTHQQQRMHRSYVQRSPWYFSPQPCFRVQARFVGTQVYPYQYDPVASVAVWIPKDAWCQFCLMVVYARIQKVWSDGVQLWNQVTNIKCWLDSLVIFKGVQDQYPVLLRNPMDLWFPRGSRVKWKII